MDRQMIKIAWDMLCGRKKENMILVLLLTISFSFIVALMSVTGTLTATNQEAEYRTYGEWKAAYDREEVGLEELEDQEWLEKIGTLDIWETVMSDEMVVSIGACDDTWRELGRIYLLSGEFPKYENEIVMEEDLLSRLGYDYQLGQKIYLDKEYTLTGILAEYSNLWSGVDTAYPEALVVNGAAVQKAKLKTYYFIKTSLSFQEIIRQMPGKAFYKNDMAYRSVSSDSYNTMFLFSILMATSISMILVYGIQAKQELKSVRLIRSIGATKSQLFMITCWKSFIVSLPAVVGGGILGCILTYLCVFQMMKTVTGNVVLRIPFKALTLVFIIWFLLITLSRLAVFFCLLRDTKTRSYVFKSEDKKTDRFRIFRREKERPIRLCIFGPGKTVLLSLMVAIIAAVTILMMVEIRNLQLQEKHVSKNVDYYVNGAITQDTLDELAGLAGIKTVIADNSVGIELSFDGWEDLEVENELYLTPTRKFSEGIGTYIHFYRDSNTYLEEMIEESGCDEEAFWKGEQVILLSNYLSGSGPQSIVSEKGTEMKLSVYASGAYVDRENNLWDSPLKVMEETVTVGGIISRNLSLEDDPFWYTYGEYPFILIASMNVYDKEISALRENLILIGSRSHPDPYIYTGALIYADDNADFFNTDLVLSGKCKEASLDLSVDREINESEKNRIIEKMLMIIILSCSVILISVFLYAFLLSYMFYFERRRYALLRCVGMSRRGIILAITGRYLLILIGAVIGSIGIYAGRLCYGAAGIYRIDSNTDLFASIKGLHFEYYREPADALLSILVFMILSVLLYMIYYWQAQQILQGNLMVYLQAERGTYE